LQAGEGQAIASFVPLLVRHPNTPSGAIQSVEAELRRTPAGALASFWLQGDISRLVIPPPAPPRRTDDLWRTTCFELFVTDEGSRYREFNLSPSGGWAAYDFDDHRSGMKPASASVEIESYIINNGLRLVAKIKSEFRNPAHIGLTAVIEETDGLLRYWATAFGAGEPDFHAAATRSLLLDGVSAE
jgi:hypothetical protein